MDISTAIRTNGSVRAFTSDPVPEVVGMATSFAFAPSFGKL